LFFDDFFKDETRKGKKYKNLKENSFCKFESSRNSIGSFPSKVAKKFCMNEREDEKKQRKEKSSDFHSRFISFV